MVIKEHIIDAKNEPISTTSQSTQMKFIELSDNLSTKPINITKQASDFTNAAVSTTKRNEPKKEFLIKTRGIKH